mmetsp:Transcript_2343/g.4726  ORF Transcript_2343/g.4726 Transcript_2343/m.4726 type:complete len:132 (+) Transcript_2343:178-573(+)|eukprot:CAMPEP_0168192546 /NCGR_PEP_ID=MMETSP0139_2-20121125/18107_1 /TAXON_ID=44445 /ORGANISM="Pseudo-nitzschia australis, Strain 10249 10 AB" /LENGTH=131 /DNA_ID=CAMNT_0008115795 /DNA_START=68 /DNA_END=466 /DNA_ORIENTATION=-
MTRSSANGSISSKSSSNSKNRIVRVEAPIRSSHSAGVIALVIGLCLVLHTPAWLILISHKDESIVLPDGDDSQSTTTAITATTTTTTILLLRFLSRWLLEFTPWLANALVSFFFGGLFLYMGAATVLGIER